MRGKELLSRRRCPWKITSPDSTTTPRVKIYDTGPARLIKRSFEVGTAHRLGFFNVNVQRWSPYFAPPISPYNAGLESLLFFPLPLFHQHHTFAALAAEDKSRGIIAFPPGLASEQRQQTWWRSCVAPLLPPPPPQPSPRATGLAGLALEAGNIAFPAIIASTESQHARWNQTRTITTTTTSRGVEASQEHGAGVAVPMLSPGDQPLFERRQKSGEVSRRV